MTITNALTKSKDILQNGCCRGFNFLTKYPLAVFPCLIIFASLFAAAAYYFYVLQAAPPADAPIVQLKTDLYQDVMDRLQARQNNIQEQADKNYPDIFR